MKKIREKMRPWCKKYGLKMLVVLLVLFNVIFVWVLARPLMKNDEAVRKPFHYSAHHMMDNHGDGYVHEFAETCINGVCKHHEDSHLLSDAERKAMIEQMHREHMRMMKEFQEMDNFFREQERLFDYYFRF